MFLGWVRTKVKFIGPSKWDRPQSAASYIKTAPEGVVSVEQRRIGVVFPFGRGLLVMLPQGVLRLYWIGVSWLSTGSTRSRGFRWYPA